MYVQKREPRIAWLCKANDLVAVLFCSKKSNGFLVERRTPKKQRKKKGVVGSDPRRQKYEYSGLPQTLPHNTQGRDAKETRNSLRFCFCAQKPEQRRSRSVSRRLTRTRTCGLGKRFGDQGEGTNRRFHRANWNWRRRGLCRAFCVRDGAKGRCGRW
ncbi:hypothetical protein M440DRAFT_281759 [Trichoderma longibrachiatum ATCC 18648]|uniref:Uncharacterized protein n=1 Tax=Trichoderma longibrachiatum ATCC 18648 TaxID=983965 RepID=A0A2T4C7H8_TRILO|nr:hypothetical protein M440DRAFT_281759 [Trichoderma longibrachiatum ATCC 18648]